MNGAPGRTVVQEDRFRRELAAIEPDVRRTDEALFYVEHLVAREPWVGLPTRQPEVWIAPILLPSGAEVVEASIFYTFDDQYVRLLSIRLDP